MFAPPFKWKSNRNAKGNTRNRRRSTFQRRCKQWRNFSAICSPEPKLKYTGSKCHGATHGTNAGERTNAREGDAMSKNSCSGTIPDIPTGCAPDNRQPEKRCETCQHFNPQFPVNGKPAPVCLVGKIIKGGTEYTNPRGTQPHFRCSNGKYESRY